jgi:hypothetical protein
MILGQIFHSILLPTTPHQPLLHQYMLHLSYHLLFTMQHPQSTMFLPQPNHQCNINPCPIMLLQSPSPTMPITFTPVETLWMLTCKTAQRIAKEQAQAAEPHLIFFFTETPMPICKNPLCCKAHHQYSNDYPFPWMGKS